MLDSDHGYNVAQDIESGVWDTVYTTPESQRSDLYGISDISVSDNGEIIAVAYPVSMDHLVLLRSSDRGENWVSGKTFFGSLGRFQFMQSITMLKNGTGLLQIDRDDAEGLRLSSWQMSTDGFETWLPLLDVHSESSFGALGSGIMTAGSNAAILLFRTGVYRTSNGGVNWTKATPELPSSPRIVSTWPQPATGGSAMNTIIDLTQPGSARLELYDLLGRRRAVLFDGHSDAARRTISWSAGGVAAGVYVLRLVVRDVVACKTFVKR